ncbi:MAG: hydrolase [Mucilaginibacter sp.]|nr:hydrolase [Mucilaginibacter sp.]
MKTIEVVAAVIFDSQKRILIAKRKIEKSLGGKWEFPGGKIEDGEDHRSALERELMEEMNIATKANRFIGSNTHHYPNFTINLYAYKTELLSSEFKLVDHDLIKWIEYNDFENYDFAEADIPIVQKLKSFLF